MRNKKSRQAQDRSSNTVAAETEPLELKPGGALVTRREMIVGLTTATIATSALLPVSAIQAAPQAGPASIAKSPASFLPEQRRILEAFIDRIIPSDENGPGAAESGAAEYIDRAFVDFLAAEKASFATGLAGLDAFAHASQNASFAELSAEKRDAVLTAIDNGEANNLRPFFNRARRLTLEGMFCDPYYGGNKNFAGWDLIRYPGIRLAVTAEDQKMNKPAVTVHRSAYALNGAGPGSEENHGH